MLFKKPLYEVNYQDIKKLKDDKIEESEILDYKEIEIDDKNVIKEVTAFSNTRGGFLIYGIKESGKGGYPVSIDGIEKDRCNAERLEQVVISDNIMPRISVQIKKIDIPDSEKKVLVIRIPEGQNKPYYNKKSEKFHKRYNFESKAMYEHEIEALYLRRFFGVGQLAKYVDETIHFNQKFLHNSKELIDGHIIITPLKIDENLVNTSNMQQLRFGPSETIFAPKKNDLYIVDIPSPSRYGLKWRKRDFGSSIEIHRNGLIHSMNNYGNFDDTLDAKLLRSNGLAVELMKTIQFANLVYSTINFTGKVKIILSIKNCLGSYMPENSDLGSQLYGHECPSETILVEREWDSWKLSEDYLLIEKSMMDELSNHYGFWESHHLF